MADATLFSTAPRAGAGVAPEQGADGASAGRYADTRESGIPWLGKVPTHWTVDRLRWTIAGSQNGTWGDEPDGLNDIICVRVADFDRTALRATIDEPTMRAVTPSERHGRVLHRGDLLLEKSGGGELQPVGAVVQYDHDTQAVCSNFVARVRVAPGFNARFLTYLHAHLYAGRINTRSIKQTTGIQNLDAMAYFDERAAWPPLPEQEAIAAWLDERTRRIDVLVAAKRRLIDLLAEQRTALITHAVTKGLNPAAPVKPSGIAPPRWLGDVPRHWEVKQLKFAATFQRGHDLPLDDRIVGDVPIVTSAGPSAWHNQPAAHGPAIVTGRYGTVGEFFLIEGPYWPLNTTLYTINLRGNEPRYLWYMLQALKGVFLMEAGKSAVPGVDRNDLHPIPVVVPPLDEQQAIVAHLDAACTKLESLIAAAEAAISRLTEYRQALISAAVTGKIRVCEAVDAGDCEAQASQPTSAVTHAAGQRRGANKHFQRTVLAAQIIATIGNKPTFGRIKLQKAMVLAEYHLRLDEIQSEPVRAAAGPFDNPMMRSVDAQLKRSQWYDYNQSQRGGKYVALAKAGGHTQYFDRYWSDRRPGFDALMKTLEPMTTEQAEIVATLYAAWNDFLIDDTAVTDDALVAEVMNNWHPDKDKITEQQWRAAIPWMRQHGLVPTGYGAHTKAGHGGTP